MAGKKWSFRVYGETIQLARPEDVPDADKTPTRLPPIEAAWAIENVPAAVTATDVMVKAELVRALEHVDGAVPFASQLSLAELRTAVADAVREEKLIAFRTSRPMRVQREVQVEPLGPQEDNTTWIEIMLLDEETKDPIADERYILETADGRKIEGTTNASGKAREEGIAPGTCKIQWPDLPDPAWSAM